MDTPPARLLVSLPSLHLLCHAWPCCQSLAQDPFLSVRQQSQAPVRNVGLHLTWNMGKGWGLPLWHFTGATEIPRFLLFPPSWTLCGVNGSSPGLMKTTWNEAVSAVTLGNSIWGFVVANITTTNRIRFLYRLKHPGESFVSVLCL